MLKLNASFSKKVPAEQEYSSKSFHASIEVELPDGLTPAQLQGRIHETFELVRGSVESEIGGNAGIPQAPPQQNGNGAFAPSGNGNVNGSFQPIQNGNGKKTGPASEKQVKYLIDLAALNGTDLSGYLRRYGASNPYGLTRDACSKLIDEIGGKNKP